MNSLKLQCKLIGNSLQINTFSGQTIIMTMKSRMTMKMVMMMVVGLVGSLGDLLGKGTIRLLGGKGLAPFWGGSNHQVLPSQDHRRAT